MRTVVIIFGLVLIALINRACISPTDDKQNNTIQKTDIPITPKLYNDKIVVIRGANYNGVKQAILQFCDLYNSRDTIIFPNLRKVNDSLFVITFSHDMTFRMFYYLINYMRYPAEIFYKADIRAWTTIEPTEAWIVDKSAAKKAMLYFPIHDYSRSIIYLTTQDNIGYKLLVGADLGQEGEILDNPIEKYIEPTVNLNDIKGPIEEIK